MKRQALYRLEWDDAIQPMSYGSVLRPPATLYLSTAGPWGTAATCELLYDGPLGRTTVTVAYTEPEKDAKAGA